MLLDDPSPLVRQALAEAFASSEEAPPTIVHALAGDQSDVASPLLERSPLFLDTDLVDAVASGDAARQVAIAGRAHLPCAVAAAIAEVGCAEVLPGRAGKSQCRDRAVLARPYRRPARASCCYSRCAAGARRSCGADPAGAGRQAVADAGRLRTSREWLASDRAQKITREACEKATVAVAADSDERRATSLDPPFARERAVDHGLVLRALLSGNLALFEEALSELTGMSLPRVAGIVHDRKGFGFRAIYEKAGLPASAYPLFREALIAMREDGFLSEHRDASRLKRRIIERVLTRCESAALDDVEPLLTLLRRYRRRGRARGGADVLRGSGGGRRDRGLRRGPGLRRGRAESGVIRTASPGAKRWARNRCQIVRPVAVLHGQELIGHLAQLRGQSCWRSSAMSGARIRARWRAPHRRAGR